MKKYLFIGIAATAMLASCTNDEIVEVAPQGNAIAFSNAFVDKATRATDVTEVSEIIVNGWRTKGTTTEQNFSNQKVTKSGGTWTYDPVQYWDANYSYVFETAYNVGNNVATWAPANAGGTITVNNNDGETDVLYARVEKAAGNQTTVEFTYNHMLSRVKFSFKNAFESTAAATITVTDVTLKAYTSASVTPVNVAKPYWTFDTNAALATTGMAFTSSEVKDMEVASDAKETEHHYIIPNAQADGATAMADYLVSFKVVLTQGSVSDTYTHTDLALPIKLQAGNSYDFTVDLTAKNVNPKEQLTPIEFSASVAAWTDKGDNAVTVPEAK